MRISDACCSLLVYLQDQQGKNELPLREGALYSKRDRCKSIKGSPAPITLSLSPLKDKEGLKKVDERGGDGYRSVACRPAILETVLVCTRAGQGGSSFPFFATSAGSLKKGKKRTRKKKKTLTRPSCLLLSCVHKEGSTSARAVLLLLHLRFKRICLLGSSRTWGIPPAPVSKEGSLLLFPLSTLRFFLLSPSYPWCARIHGDAWS